MQVQFELLHIDVCDNKHISIWQLSLQKAFDNHLPLATGWRLMPVQSTTIHLMQAGSKWYYVQDRNHLVPQ